MDVSTTTNAFTVDVEDYFHVSAYNTVIDRSDWESLPSRVERNTQAMMEILDDHDTKGTFFVLGWVAERYPGLVKSIARNGHEIASHGMSHRLIYQQGRKAFKDEAKHSKELLEDICGEAVNGYRAASFFITKASIWALDDLADLGFTYDSSIFPVRHDRYGIPDAPRRPFKYLTASGNSIVEFPLTSFNLFGWNMPVSGGGYFRLFPYWLTKLVWNKLVNGGEPCIFYAHPWEIDPDQPRFEAGAISNFRHWMNLSTCESRLQKLLADFDFTTVEQVLERTDVPSHSLTI